MKKNRVILSLAVMSIALIFGCNPELAVEAVLDGRAGVTF
jgi:hypothetical protein